MTTPSSGTPVPHPIKTVSRRKALAVNRFLTVELHTVEFPNGRRVDDWAWLQMPDYAVILARTPDGRFLSFRQVKYAIPDAFLAPPGGYLDPGEDPLNAARRELLEETGCEARAWHPLGSYVVDSNRGAGTAHLFLALDVRPVAPVTADDLEDQELVYLTRADLERSLDTGAIRVLAWAALLGLALRKLDVLAPE